MMKRMSTAGWIDTIGIPACGWASPMDQTKLHKQKKLTKKKGRLSAHKHTKLAVEATLKNHTSAETTTIIIPCVASFPLYR